MLKAAIQIIVVTFLSSTVSGEIVYDTGANIPPGYPAEGWPPIGVAVDNQQYVAIKFSLEQATTVSAVEGWIYPWMPSGVVGAGTIAIYSDDGILPGDEIYSSAFEVAQPTGGQETTSIWQGAYNLSWGLDTGTYWASFEVREGQTLSAAMTGAIPAPSVAYASYDVLEGTWHPSSFATGLRVHAVPVPPSLWLFGSALLALTGRRAWRRKNQKVAGLNLFCG